MTRDAYEFDREEAAVNEQNYLGPDDAAVIDVLLAEHREQEAYQLVLAAAAHYAACVNFWNACESELRALRGGVN